MIIKWINLISITLYFSLAHSAEPSESEKLTHDFNKSNVSDRELITAWKKIDSKLRAISSKEADLSNQKMDLELALNTTSENIKQLNLTLKDKQNQVISQIRYLTQNVGGDFIRNLLDSSNPGELERNHKLLSLATKYDLDLIRFYNRDLVKLENERKLESLRISKMNDLQRQLQNQTDSFEKELKSKGFILDKIRRKLSNKALQWQQELKLALEKGDHEKINFYQALLQRNLFDRKGHFPSPVNGKLKYRFGILKLDALAPAIPFHGIFLDAASGLPVRAIADGKILWIGEIKELGSSIILDHGRGILSFYSKLQLSKLKLGEMISEGTIIGKVDRSKQDLFGSGLYFEIRENSIPSDPSKWISIKSDLLIKDSSQWENIQ